ncbi:DnaJ domain protein [Choristoneura rosaceana nucleopolyhedrovirus]|uniref:DnaJ domain protein n=1 Tax=Choristoneura rosaceana nucleopolyhedrovirus TaxID=58094 RepID=S5N433_9ABAC|nr:DnaJ domain protein [Choristoneura rosaceana nucleopolyhedrovirus]AGR57135.1 DnaJ domain protein [Choristoneura rosaceana nucleopolyhedrovirus]
MYPRPLKRVAEPIVKKDKKRTKGVLLGPDFLGTCSLREINYYEALQFEFKEKQEMTHADFVLLVVKNTNIVVQQVRKYPKVTDMHVNNVVNDVLILIKHARSVLMNENKKRRYDKIIIKKNSQELKYFDSLMFRLDSTCDDLSSALQEFKNKLQSFTTPTLNPTLKNLLMEALEEWLVAQRVKIKRPTSANRVLITWPPFDEELNFNKEQIKELIYENFKVYGDIVNVYICDINRYTAIVEYAKLEGQQKAINENKSSQVRYTVTEYMLTKYYNTHVRKRLHENMKKISDDIKLMRDRLTGLAMQYI